MTNSNNKILTVTYGTFSCTLEGFEDSFGTMKVIAEYFRDLTSEDRYFGSVPPQPDGDLLALIAQREAQRRVQAHQRDGRLVLSALPADPQDAPNALTSDTSQTQPAPLHEKLARIQNVMNLAQERPRATQYDEDQHAEDFLQATVAELEAIQDEEDRDATLSEDQRDEDGYPLQTELEARDEPRQPSQDERVGDPDPEPAAAAVAEDSRDADPAPETAPEEHQGGAETARPDPVAADEAPQPAAEDHDDDADDPYEDEIPAEADSASEPLAVTAEDRVDTAEEAERIRRVVKVRRPEPKVGRDDSDTQAARPSSLSEEEEAELMADLSDIEELDEAVDGTEILEDIDQSDNLEDDEDDIAGLEAAEEPDVNRLLAKADTQLDEPAATQRRNAFEALKAAVAARKAEAASASSTPDTGDAEREAYQANLNEVVRERGSVEAQTGPEPRQAPLRLVAEQRVDRDITRPDPGASEGARPATDAADGPGVEFSDYARRAGAKDLISLFEAAAAYLVFVQGKDYFSRPQLMTKVRQVVMQDFSREEGLRAFGQLLRSGKIRKVRGGRFVVTNEIRFKPDDRAAC